MNAGNSHIGLIIVFLVSLLGAACPGAAEISLSTGMYYDLFSDNRSPQASGYEITLPLSLAYDSPKIFFSLETAYSSVYVTPGTIDKVRLSGMTDTFCAFSYALLDFPINLIVGLDMNFPTGKEQLTQKEQIAEVGENQDLLRVDDFGEGLSVGPHFGVVKQYSAIRLGVYAGYTLYQEYDPTDEILDDDFEPGDQLLVMTALDWQVSPQFLVDTFLAYAHCGEDEMNNRTIFQEGDKLVLGGAALWQRDALGIHLSWQNTMQMKNDELVEELLETETENSNRIELFGSLEADYTYSPDLILHCLGDIRYYGESKRKSTLNGRPFKGRRIRYTLGSGFSYAHDRHVSYHGTAKYVILRQESNVLLEEDVKFHGIDLGIGMTYTF